MQMKVSNFTAVIEDDSIVDYGKMSSDSRSEQHCTDRLTNSYPLYTYTPASGGNPASTENYTIPGGSIIKLRFGFKRGGNSFYNLPRMEVN